MAALEVAAVRVLVPIVSCPACGALYSLEVNLLGPSWIYVRPRSCRRHPLAVAEGIPADELELAELPFAIEAPA